MKKSSYESELQEDWQSMLYHQRNKAQYCNGWVPASSFMDVDPRLVTNAWSCVLKVGTIGCRGFSILLDFASCGGGLVRRCDHEAGEIPRDRCSL